jgi:hypothetical protein
MFAVSTRNYLLKKKSRYSTNTWAESERNPTGETATLASAVSDDGETMSGKVTGWQQKQMAPNEAEILFFFCLNPTSLLFTGESWSIHNYVMKTLGLPQGFFWFGVNNLSAIWKIWKMETGQ